MIHTDTLESKRNIHRLGVDKFIINFNVPVCRVDKIWRDRRRNGKDHILFAILDDPRRSVVIVVHHNVVRFLLKDWQVLLVMSSKMIVPSKTEILTHVNLQVGIENFKNFKDENITKKSKPILVPPWLIRTLWLCLRPLAIVLIVGHHFDFLALTNWTILEIARLCLCIRSATSQW